MFVPFAGRIVHRNIGGRHNLEWLQDSVARRCTANHVKRDMRRRAVADAVPRESRRAFSTRHKAFSLPGASRALLASVEIGFMAELPPPLKDTDP